MTEDLYPRLAGLVAGRRVDMLCRKDGPIPHEPDLVVRFNHDEAPADIWATAFFGVPSVTLSRGARLIVGTVPDCRWEVHPHGWPKDFSAEKVDYLARGGIPAERVEQVDFEHWRSLIDELPAVPLSGLVFLSMLRRTRVDRCVIHDMDFYSTATTPLRSGRWHGDVHDLHFAALWVRRLLRDDRRFEFVGDIDACVDAAQARIAAASAELADGELTEGRQA